MKLTKQQLRKLFDLDLESVCFYPSNVEYKSAILSYEETEKGYIIEYYPGGGKDALHIHNPTIKLLWLMGYRIKGDK